MTTSTAQLRGTQQDSVLSANMHRTDSLYNIIVVRSEIASYIARHNEVLDILGSLITHYNEVYYLDVNKQPLIDIIQKYATLSYGFYTKILAICEQYKEHLPKDVEVLIGKWSIEQQKVNQSLIERQFLIIKDKITRT